ncbi:hypothetical protein H4R34_005205, partial [Dimargaris verticillata]
MLLDLRIDMIHLQHIYRKRIDNPDLNDYDDQYPDVFELPRLPEMHYGEELHQQLEKRDEQLVHRSILDIHPGYLKEPIYKDPKKAAGLVNKYLQTIHHADLLPFLQGYQHDPYFKFWVKAIAQNNSLRARYYLNDIVAFQVIPKIAINYVMAWEFPKAIEFIDEILRNKYLKGFLESISAVTGVYYYEQV